MIVRNLFLGLELETELDRQPIAMCYFGNAIDVSRSDFADRRDGFLREVEIRHARIER